MATAESIRKMRYVRTRLARGLCEKCPKLRAPGDATYCQTHREKRRLQTALWYRRCLRQGTAKPVKCPRNGCGGTMLLVDHVDLEGGGKEWKCQGCSRRYPATTVSGPVMAKDREAAAERGETMPRTETIRRAGAELAAQPSRDKSRPPQCLWRQGRGRCKKDARQGSEFCGTHSRHWQESTGQESKIDARVRAALEPPARLPKAPVPRPAKGNGACAEIRLALEQIQGQVDSLEIRRAALEEKRKALETALAILEKFGQCTMEPTLR